MIEMPLIYAACTFVSTLLGGLFALRFSGWMDRIMAFSGGVLLAAGLLDLMPEAIALSTGGARHSISAHSAYRPLFFAVIGFIFFYLVERMAILRSYHSHHHHPAPPASESPNDQSPPADDGASRRQVGILGAAGLCVHSLLDGFSIGIAFKANTALGLLVAIAVIAHDFSDGVTTVVLLLSNRNSRSTSMAWLLLDALAPLAGVGLASVLSLSPRYLADLLAVFAGMFLYLGATHMLPEAHALSDSWITVAWTLIGVAFMVLVTQWAG